jgi:shikimate 5-dehydrogenase
MLIQQAKHSFVIWNDLIPDVNNLEEKLREL